MLRGFPTVGDMLCWQRASSRCICRLPAPGLRGSASRRACLTHASGPLTGLLLAIAHVWRATRAGRADVGGDCTHGLPPGMPVPATFLTYAYWRSPFSYMERCQARYGKRFTHKMTSFPRLVFLSDPAEVKAMLDGAGRGAASGRGWREDSADRRPALIHAAGCARASERAQSGASGVAEAHDREREQLGYRHRATHRLVMAARRAPAVASASACAGAERHPATHLRRGRGTVRGSAFEPDGHDPEDVGRHGERCVSDADPATRSRACGLETLFERPLAKRTP